MAQFFTTSAFVYNDAGATFGGGAATNYFVDDGELDSVFTIGDTYSGFTYAGRIEFDGETVPIFFTGVSNSYVVYSTREFGDVAPPGSITPPSTINDFTVCFAAGTMIAAPTGECPVETLSIGDRVLTSEGLAKPVRWIGRQTLLTVDCPERLSPVRIRAGALGEGQPNKDLIVTADHGMIIDGLVINAGALINGSTVDFVQVDELPARMTVYHVETENHDVILANGAPSETFIDYRDRRAFDNFGEYLELYGVERIIRELPLPRISAQRHLPAGIRSRLGLGNRQTETRECA